MQNNNPQYDDFFCYGPWAVVDGYTDELWINVEHKALAEMIASTFFCKLNAVVVDISKANNYEPNLIDNSVVLEWSLQQIDRKTHGLPCAFDYDREKADYQAHGRNLINLTRSGEGLSRQQRQALQGQIISLIKLMYDMHPDLAYFGTPVQNINDSILHHVLDCYRIELTLVDIESRLYEVAMHHMHDHGSQCLLILNFLDRFYD